MTSSNARPPSARVLRPERDEGQPDVLLEVGIEEQDLVLADGSVVVEDHLAAPQPPHDLREVLHLRSGHGRDAECAVHGRHAATDAQREPSAGEAVHGRRPRTGDQRMAGVVIGCCRCDLHPVGHCASGADKGRCLLDVPTLGDECRAEAEFFAAPGFVHQRGRPLPARTRQQVVAHFIEHAFGHDQTPC